MPRIVDHEQRRREIADAAWAVISRAGIDAASLQRIASELGSTTGSVTHYFSNKEELISFAFERTTAIAFEDIESATTRVGPGLPRVRIALERWTPLLASSGSTGSAVLSYWGLATSEPMYAQLHQKSYVIWEAMLERFMLEAIDLGQIAHNVDVQSEIRILMTFADGLLVGGVLEPKRVTRARSRRLLEAMLTRLQRPAALSDALEEGL